MRASSNALRPREQPGRLEQQHHDDDQEAHGITVSRGDVAGTDLLDEGEYESADGRAGDIAETAEDDDRERLERGEVAHGRRDEKNRAEQRARRGRKRGADGEGHG